MTATLDAAETATPWTLVLQAFRAVLPAAAGVVLATVDGRCVASDAPDAESLAREAVGLRREGESALVPRGDALFLVVFVPADGSTLFRPAGTAAA